MSALVGPELAVGELPILNLEVVSNTDTGLLVVGRLVTGQGLGGLRGKEAVGRRTCVMGDGGSCGTGLVMPHRSEGGQSGLPAWLEK